MKKEDIVKRMAQIEEKMTQTQDVIKQCHSQIEQLIANLNILQGGKSECLHWLSELEKNESNEIVKEPELDLVS